MCDAYVIVDFDVFPIQYDVSRNFMMLHLALSFSLLCGE